VGQDRPVYAGERAYNLLTDCPCHVIRALRNLLIWFGGGMGALRSVSAPREWRVRRVDGVVPRGCDPQPANAARPRHWRTLRQLDLRHLSSVVRFVFAGIRCRIDTDEVTGSNPVSPTPPETLPPECFTLSDACAVRLLHGAAAPQHIPPGTGTSNRAAARSISFIRWRSPARRACDPVSPRHRPPNPAETWITHGPPRTCSSWTTRPTWSIPP
jgi:hypothetical protein